MMWGRIFTIGVTIGVGEGMSGAGGSIVIAGYCCGGGVDVDVVIGLF